MLNNSKIVVLAGGVGAAKLIRGLIEVLPQEKFQILVNTGDDINLFGLKICPDLDIITYTVAEVVDDKKGWGFKDETFNSLKILRRYYGFDWFNMGDKDAATHIYRTDLFSKGYSKSEITRRICNKLGVKCEIIPMTNKWVETRIITPIGDIHFEEYFIKYKSEIEVNDIIFNGIEEAKPIDGVLEKIKEAYKIIICPSNPIVSIGPILKIKGIKETLKKVKDKIIGVSPIIEGAPVKGPTDKLMKALNLEVSSFGVAKIYSEILGHFIIDIKDEKLKPQIESLGIKTYTFDTLMMNLRKKIDLAEFIIKLNI
jgi:LPPG:FO 2-phospho-L-lactate transferase